MVFPLAPTGTNDLKTNQPVTSVSLPEKELVIPIY